MGQPPKYIGYEDEVYKVTGISDETEKNGALLYECECKSSRLAQLEFGCKTHFDWKCVCVCVCRLARIEF